MSDRFRRKQKLDSLFEKARLIPDPEIQSHWARYLCVLVYGYAERTVVEIVEDYCRKACCPRSFSFISSKLKRINNVSPAEIEELLGALDKMWLDSFKASFDGSTERDHFSSVTNNRNRISHGEDSGVRMSTITTYRQSLDRILDEMEVIVS